MGWALSNDEDSEPDTPPPRPQVTPAPGRRFLWQIFLERISRRLPRLCKGFGSAFAGTPRFGIHSGLEN